MSDPNNPDVTITVTLAENNFIIKTLNRNPLGADVMEVAALMNKLAAAAQATIDAANKAAAEKQKLLDAAAKAEKPKSKKTATPDTVAGVLGIGGAGDPA